MKCPGQDMRYWKPGDIFNAKCPRCGGSVEFFKDEVRRKCRCGNEVINPKLDFGCAAWCPYAEQCVGALPEEVKARQNEDRRASFRDRMIVEMKKTFGKDLKRIDHALKVANYAEQILKREGGDPLVILGAAYYHDIGLSRLAGDGRGGEGEEVFPEGPDTVGAAREILQRSGIGNDEIDEICDIIGHAHEPREEETLNFQVFYEADQLVEAEEKAGSQGRKKAQILIEESFKTEAGRELAEKLFGF